MRLRRLLSNLGLSFLLLKMGLLQRCDQGNLDIEYIPMEPAELCAKVVGYGRKGACAGSDITGQVSS